MAVTEHYKAMIRKFIRPGKAWSGENFKRLIGALGIEFGRIDQALETMEDARNISHADVMIEDYEKEYGVPFDPEFTQKERQNRVLAKERAKNEASEAYLTNIIEAFGYTVVNWQRHRPTRSGAMLSGNHLTSPAWIYAIRITLEPAPQGDKNYNNMVAAVKEAAHANMILIFE